MWTNLDRHVNDTMVPFFIIVQNVNMVTNEKRYSRLSPSGSNSGSALVA